MSSAAASPATATSSRPPIASEHSDHHGSNAQPHQHGLPQHRPVQPTRCLLHRKSKPALLQQQSRTLLACRPDTRRSQRRRLHRRQLQRSIPRVAPRRRAFQTRSISPTTQAGAGTPPSDDSEYALSATALSCRARAGHRDMRPADLLVTIYTRGHSLGAERKAEKVKGRRR